jgi:hypothetical protein
VKLDLALRAVHHSERRLAEQLLELGERHKADHDVFHLSKTLAGWARGHMRALAEAGKGFDLDLDADEPGSDGSGGPLTALREKTAELVGRRPEPGLLLLRDLRRLHPPPPRPRSTGRCSARARRRPRIDSCSISRPHATRRPYARFAGRARG